MTAAPEAPMPALTAGRKHSFAPDVIIFLASAVLLLWGLGDRSLWRSEGRWAEIPREMVLSGDYFHPTMGGELYNDKPLLTYWLRLAAAKITGDLDEFSVRLPGALAGLIAVGATMWLGRRLWSAPVGWIAGTILATAWGFLFWSRTAAADTENLAAIMLAVAWYWYMRDRPGFVAFLVFWLIAFIGALTKGLPAVVVSVLAILPDIVENKRWRQVVTPSNIIAAIIAAVFYLVPFVIAARTRTDVYQADGLALVIRENITRFINPFDHKGPPIPVLHRHSGPADAVGTAGHRGAVVGLFIISEEPGRVHALAGLGRHCDLRVFHAVRLAAVLLHPAGTAAGRVDGGRDLGARQGRAAGTALRWHARNVQAGDRGRGRGAGLWPGRCWPA